MAAFLCAGRFDGYDIKADFLHESRPKIIWSYYVLSTNVSVLINEKAS